MSQGPTVSVEERAVLRCVIEGRSSRQISDLLQLPVNRVDSIIRTARLRLGVGSRLEAASLALGTTMNGMAGVSDSIAHVQFGRFEPQKLTGLDETKKERTNLLAYVGFASKERAKGVFLRGAGDRTILFTKGRHTPAAVRMVDLCVVLAAVMLASSLTMATLVAVLKGVSVMVSGTSN